ncbi:hypothetical protein ACWOC9_00005 [Enterococcus termitis]|uniref:Uncharacterized protein n=1 Tax=Enterococcus termitis TaxID=332950 RepID=A0A1E5H4V6_9ENTE|nr:hypothetical protein [Enterococcus termitis]OEG20007.1 hypothetical protein BCR25_14560 [Enterococcus termitis]
MNIKEKYREKIKKKLFNASLLAVLVGGGIVSSVSEIITNEAPVYAEESSKEIKNGVTVEKSGTSSYALSLPSGNTQIGSLDGVPVIKSGTKDMSSQAFQDLVNSIVAETDAQYIVNETFWGSNTQLVGGTPISNMPSGQSFWLKADGFTNSDNYVELSKNGKALIKAVGHATDTESGNQIPLDLGIIYRDSDTSNASRTGEKVYMSAKSQNGVITLGWVAPADAGSTDTGGSSEGGGSTGGSGSGDMASYLNRIRFDVVLLNANTGQPLPDDKTLMAMKLSDIDGATRFTISV